jgi:hypothetical protein
MGTSPALVRQVRQHTPLHPLGIVNPLPLALAHYESSLRDYLGHGSACCSHPGVEATSGGSRVERLRAHRRALQEAAASHAHVLDLWPATAAFEPLVLPRRTGQARLSVVVHDPVSLRRRASWRGEATATAMMARVRGVDLVVHSAAAARALTVAGRAPRLLPVPLRAPAPSKRRGQQAPVVTVLGQFKPTRDLALLEALGARLAATGVGARIVGRGWPSVPGWQVQDRFLTEAEFDAELDSSSALLVPYQRFWQSGVAVRAVERGCPAVGLADSHVGEVQPGANWLVPGVADEPAGTRAVEAWWEALERALLAPSDLVHQQAVAYYEAGRAAWCSWAQDLPRSA